VLADILSRYASELSVAETRELSRPGTIMVHAIDLKVDNRVCKDLKNLGKLQNTDPRLKGLKDKVTEDTSPPGAKSRRKMTSYSVGGTVRTRGRPCCRLV